MDAKINNINVFLSATSNLEKEVKEIKNVENTLNSILHNFNVNVKFLFHSIDGYSSNDSDAQAVINNEFKNYQIYLGVLWDKIGSKTNRDISGTVEEYRIAKKRFDSGEKIKLMFLFKDKSLPINVDTVQLELLNSFKKEIESASGIYYRKYKTILEFSHEIIKGVANNILELISDDDKNNISSDLSIHIVEIRKLVEEFIKVRLRIEENFSKLQISLDEGKVELPQFNKDDLNVNPSLFVLALNKVSEQIFNYEKVVDKCLNVTMKDNLELFKLFNAFIIYVNIIPELKENEKIYKVKQNIEELLNNYSYYISLFGLMNNQLDLKINLYKILLAGNRQKIYKESLDSLKRIQNLCNNIIEQFEVIVKYGKEVLEKVSK